MSVAIYYFFPANLFTWLINASGAIALFAYLLIAISELVMLGVILAAYLLRRWFGPPERSPTEIIREHEDASS